MRNNILVVGSTNTDMVIKTKHFPLPGETVLGGRFIMNPGGKGANQAVAAARLGGQVAFITKLGNDIFGKQAMQQFQKEGILTDYVLSDPDHPSGVALITVDAKGENSIVVAPGANGALTPPDVLLARPEFDRCAVVLMQLEVPLETVAAAASLAASLGKKVMLNPAPAAPLSDELLRNLFLITPNRAETEALTGIPLKDLPSMEAAARHLRTRGVENVVITLGAEGAYLCNAHTSRLIPTVRTEAVDTTAAGDVFNGALVVALSEDMPMEAAVEFANRAAAISVTRMGAQASAPFRRELQAVR